MFALLLVFASIPGFVFQSDPHLQHQLLDSTLERMPVIGPQISGDIGTLSGSGVALALGLAGALWTGLGVTLAIGNALDRIWAVPGAGRPGFLSSRLRGLLVLASIGIINVLATAAVGLVTAGGVGTVVTKVLRLVAPRSSTWCRLPRPSACSPRLRSQIARSFPGPSWRPAAGSGFRRSAASS